MPIANGFLANHRILIVKNPVFDPSGKIPTFQGSSFFEVVCKSFSSQTQMTTSNKTLVQDWPAAKYLDIKPYSYTTKIELPILLDKVGIHSNELAFFNAWLKYMLSSFDTINGTGYELASLVVEEASIRVSEADVSLSLTFKSNFPLGWGPTVSGGASTYSKTLHARKAKYYDTFVKFNEYNDGPVNTNRILGWNNKYGISSFNITYQSETEEIFLSMHEFNDSVTIDSTSLIYPHMTDMINVKSINYNGQIEVFGPEIELLGVSAQTAGDINFMSISQDIFSMALSLGAIQVYVGSLDLNNTPTNYSYIVPLTFLPTGILISEATSEFAGGQVYKHNRKFNGVFTDSPTQILQDSTVINTYLS